MKIRSVRISKLYSFGPLKEFGNFTDFNLFIGPNGSGKTNALRVLAGLPFDFSSIGNVRRSKSTHTAGMVTSTVTAFIPIFGEMSDTVINRDAWISDIAGELTISYEETTSIAQTTAELKEIVCRDNADGYMEFNSGDVVSYARRVQRVVTMDSDYAFFKQLCLVLGAHEIRTEILNLGLFYIFGLHYWFNKDGTFVQGKKTRAGKNEHDYQTLPSGVLQIAKTLTGILEGQDRPIILIDEPELHVEPRQLRAFLEFLIWYCSRSKNFVSETENEIVSRVEGVLKSTRFGTQTLTNIPKKIGNPLHGKQVFISSHSSVLINEFLHLSEVASVYEFSLKDMPFNRINKVIKHLTGEDTTEASLTGTFSDVRKVQGLPKTILDGLGCKGADLLQCNGVVWVEGPSDVIYIRKWLELYARENDQLVPLQGRDYEFQMYGGTLLDSICLEKEEGNNEKNLKKLVEMFSFSRNAYVVIDSDAVRDIDGSVYDKSNFAAAKKFIRAQFDVLANKGMNLGLWYEADDTEIITIEDYLNDASRDIANTAPTKKIGAQKATSSWNVDTKLESFSAGLEPNIASLFGAIQNWRRD